MGMKALARLCVRIGFLPNDPRFAKWLRQQLYVPLHPRDQATGMDGYFDFGDMNPRAVSRFRRWWRTWG